MNWFEVLAGLGTVGGTWALVGVTWRLAKGQLSLVAGQLSVAKEQQKIQLYLELRKDFDGPLISARRSLARQLLDDAPHDDIKETVMDFFEDMGMLIRRDFVDSEMIWATFSFYASNWWRASRARATGR